MKKRCVKCKKKRDIEKFVKSSYSKDGYKNTCKQCYRKKSLEYYYKNKDKMLAASKDWREKNKDYTNLRDASRYHKVNFVPKGRMLGRTREQAEKHTKEYLRKWYLENRERVLSNAQLTKDRRNFMRRQRLKNNPTFRISSSFRSRLSRFIKKAQRESSMELLGCNFEEFRNWIEKHFKEGMNWSNYGRGQNRWCIDHHFPCASFDLTDPEQQKICFHYTNLYPMWYIDNCRKNAQKPDQAKQAQLEAFPEISRNQQDISF